MSLVYAGTMNVSPSEPKVGDTVTATATTEAPDAHHASFLWQHDGTLKRIKGLLAVINGRVSDSCKVDEAGFWFVEANIYNATGTIVDHSYTSFTVKNQTGVGGVFVPVDKLTLLAPYIALAITVVAISIGAMYMRNRWFGKAIVQTP